MNWLLNFCDHMCLECAIDKYDKVMHEYMNRVATYDYFRFASQVELEQEKKVTKIGSKIDFSISLFYQQFVLLL